MTWATLFRYAFPELDYSKIELMAFQKEILRQMKAGKR